MSAVTRSSIVEGPAVVKRGSVLYYTEGAVRIGLSLEPWRPQSSLHGAADARATDKAATVSFKPFGMLTAVADYFPWNNLDTGKWAFPAVDVPLEIYTADGTHITFKASAMSALPRLLLGADRLPIGDMTFMLLAADGAEETDADARFVVEAAALASHTFDPAKAPTPRYVAVYGTGETAITILSNDGFEFDAGMRTNPRKANGFGTVQLKIAGFEPSVAFSPLNLTEEEALDLMGWQGEGAIIPGQSLSAAGQQLIIKPDDPNAKGVTLTIPICGVASGEQVFSQTDPRHGKLVFMPRLTFSSGAPQAMWSIAFPSWA